MSTLSYILSIDQGTTSSRAILFDRAGSPVASHQEEFEQIMPQPGWVEHDPMAILSSVRRCVAQCCAAVGDATAIVAVGITNQRETTVVWDARTGVPLCNAIVWMDVRTASICAELEGADGIDRFRAVCGLPLSHYFSGTKLRWILENVEGARALAEAGHALFGTVDTWLAWNLTGGVDGGQHITDVTNASRTMLMNLTTLDWDDELLAAFGVPRAMLPRIGPSGGALAAIAASSLPPLAAGTPLSALIGDQSAALFGQTCFGVGDVKNTYGTGCFMLCNTGVAPPRASKNGLLTTLGYQITLPGGGEGAVAQPAVYALEGGVAIAGALVQWLRDNLGIINDASEIGPLASSVEDNGGCYFVPAFSGLFAPHWRKDARGCVVGLTRFVTKAHIARAALEATAFQAKELLDAMVADINESSGGGAGGAAGEPLTAAGMVMRVDGGMTASALLMQFQADLLELPVQRPAVKETTALGAAFAAGLAVGFWSDLDELRGLWQLKSEWRPTMDARKRAKLLRKWHKAVQRSLDWVDDDDEGEEE
tara:strand:- start:145 stop:1761 length:1617 start_codon:yes stop_codon:yes gene_type:complete